MGPIGDYSGGLLALLRALSWASLLFVPLAIWKLVEIVWWLVSHLHWS